MNKTAFIPGSMTGDISIKLLLVCSFLVSGLIPIMIVSLIGFNTAKVELKEQAFRQLESVRNIKKEQIKNFFSERINNISVFVNNPYIIAAYRDLKNAFEKAGGTGSKRFKGYLEETYDAPVSYKKAHDRYFPFLKSMIRQYGYYDFFLMDPIHGDTVFTVRKESDFGIRIGGVSSSLRDVWLKSCVEKRIALSDTKPYPPSHNDPAQFLAAPIIKDQTVIGVVAVQVSIDSIDKFLAENKKFGFCHITAVLNLIARKAKVQGNSPRPRTDDPEIGNQPIHGVHHQMNHFISLADPFMNQDIRKAIHPLVELLPSNLTPLLLTGYSLNESHIVRVHPRISC